MSLVTTLILIHPYYKHSHNKAYQNCAQFYECNVVSVQLQSTYSILILVVYSL